MAWHSRVKSGGRTEACDSDLSAGIELSGKNNRISCLLRECIFKRNLLRLCDVSERFRVTYSEDGERQTAPSKAFPCIPAGS